jgi:hypothetical protein
MKIRLSFKSYYKLLNSENCYVHMGKGVNFNAH